MTYVPHSNRYKPKQSADIEYLVEQERKKQDFTNLIDKRVIKLSLPKGFYGFTYLNHGEMYINNDLIADPEQNNKTQVHEAIHTDDEYETRQNTDHMLDINIDSIERKILSMKKEYSSEDRYVA